jgi:hypothetical protein
MELAALVGLLGAFGIIIAAIVGGAKQLARTGATAAN